MTKFAKRLILFLIHLLITVIMDYLVKEDLCRIIRTISPSQKTADKLCDELTTESANYLLDLLKSPTIFRFIFFDDIIFNEIAKRVSEFCRDVFMRESYDLLFDLYLDELIEKARSSPANCFTGFVIFEINHRRQLIDNYDNNEKVNELEDLYDVEIQTRHEELIDSLHDYLDDLENLETNLPFVRMALETIVILNCSIMGNPGFSSLIANRRAEFTAALQ